MNCCGTLGTSVVLPLEDPQATGNISWPRVAAECQYHDSARFEDQLDIEVCVVRIGTASITYGFRFRVKQREIATGTLTSVCCRFVAGKPPESDADPGATSDAIVRVDGVVNVKPSYLQQLTIRLAMGLEQVPEQTRTQHADFLKRAQRPDGGFAGRMGDERSVLYELCPARPRRSG